MGYGRIFVVYEDGIQEAERSVEAWDRLRPEVGEAVLKVCFDRTLSLEGERVFESHRVGHHGNCVTHVDEKHGTDEELYLWGLGCLRPLGKLHDSDLDRAEELLSAERRRRAEEH